MANEDFPTINGIAPSWSDLELKCQLYDGPEIILPDISDVSWGDPVEIGVQRGAGGRIRRRTTGSSTPEASMTMYRSGFRELLRAFAEVAVSLGLVRGNAARVGLVHFDLLVHHTPPGEAEIFKTKIIGCRLTNRSMGLSEGTDADKVEVPLHPVEIIDYAGDQEIVLV